MTSELAARKPVQHHCPPVCHWCPGETDDDEPMHMPMCMGGAVYGHARCHCPGDYDLAELVQQRGYLRRELARLDERIRVAERASHAALVALGPRKGA